MKREARNLETGKKKPESWEDRASPRDAPRRNQAGVQCCGSSEPAGLDLSKRTDAPVTREGGY